MCHFVLVFFSHFSIAITSLREETANLSAFRTFVRFVLVWICRFSLPLGVWERDAVCVALPGLFSYLFLPNTQKNENRNLSLIETLHTVAITVDSRYLEFQGTLLKTSRYPYLDI